MKPANKDRRLNQWEVRVRNDHNWEAYRVAPKELLVIVVDRSDHMMPMKGWFRIKFGPLMPIQRGLPYIYITNLVPGSTIRTSTMGHVVTTGPIHTVTFERGWDPVGIVIDHPDYKRIRLETYNLPLEIRVTQNKLQP